MLRRKVSGTRTRFSAQSVSMIPVSGDSRRSAKPASVQKSRSTGQTLSGGASTTSQRCEPCRSMRTPLRAGSTDGPEAAGRCSAPFENCE